MKMNLKVVALINSLNQTDEVTIVEMVGNNKYLADYRGNLCAAMFNPFLGLYYVDDIHGKFPAMSQEEVDNALYELRFLSESTERQLNAYRSLGSVKHLKHLREQEIRRNKNWNLFKKTLKSTVITVGVALLTWIFVSGIISIFA
jgi:hypothetical protein